MIHSCTLPAITHDTRQDRTFMPPTTEERPRCLTCGWQGSWRVASLGAGEDR